MKNKINSELVVITSFFNPLNIRSRLENYKRFLKYLNAPLITIELSFNGIFTIPDQEKNIVIRLNEGDIMWQKERLLNIALKYLPSTCRYVVWMDSDVIFKNNNWVSKIECALAKYKVIQGFKTVVDLDFNQEISAAIEKEKFRYALVYLMEKGIINKSIFKRVGNSLSIGYSPGHVWAARREIIEKNGFYDGMILGSGDKAMAAAGYGMIEEFNNSVNLNNEMKEHYSEWSNKYYKSVKESIGFADNTIYHLWHGDLVYRGYKDRYKGLKNFKIIPYENLILTNENTWTWNYVDQDLKNYIKDYFVSRKEQ